MDLIKYAITISPSKTTTERHLIINIYKRWRTFFAENIDSRLYLYPELAVNDEGLRLHFHGIIENDDRLEMYTDLEKLKKICFIKVKEITNIKSWIKYCRKEWKITHKTLIENGRIKENNIIINKQKGTKTEYTILDQFMRYLEMSQ